MYLLKLVCLTLFKLAEQALYFPQTVVVALKEKRQQDAQNHSNTERLDRIRHPEKYLSK